MMVNNIDEKFYEEMLKDIRDYHIENGCPEQIATELALLNVYRCRDLNLKRDIKKSVEIRTEIYNIIKRYRRNRTELIHSLFCELRNLILLLEGKRKEEQKISLKIFLQDGNIVFRLITE